MKKETTWIIILTALAVGGFIWATDERNKRIKAEKTNKILKRDYLKLLEEYLIIQKGLPQEIKNQITHLRQTFIGLDDEVSIELQTILELIEAHKEEIAIEKLTKVIENLMKDKYVAEGHAKDRKSCPQLFKMLEKAKDLCWITLQEFRFSCFLKDERNEEAHELAVRFPKNWKYISFLAGIEIIYNLRGIKRI